MAIVLDTDVIIRDERRAFDLKRWVVATALEHGGTVATFNRRHFSQVRGLKVVVPA